MKIYIINLKRDVSKRENMISQFDHYGITNFEFIEAVDGRCIKDISKLYNDLRARKIFRSLTRGEIGCALSHIKTYKKIIEKNERAIILEDDVIITKQFADIATSDKVIDDDIDVIFWGFGTSNVDNEHAPKKTYDYSIISKKHLRGRLMRCYFEEVEYDYISKFYKIDNRMFEIDFIWGTYAYSPSIDTCKTFIKMNEPVMIPADYLWNFYKRLAGKPLTMYGPMKELVVVKPGLSDLSLERNNINKDGESASFFRKRITSPLYNL
jgi:GR25 family glycosyltransferase involved in LPS biosynthesis